MTTAQHAALTFLCIAPFVACILWLIWDALDRWLDRRLTTDAPTASDCPIGDAALADVLARRAEAAGEMVRKVGGL